MAKRRRTFHQQYHLIPSHVIEVVRQDVIWAAASRLFGFGEKPVALMDFRSGRYVVEKVADTLEWASLLPVQPVEAEAAQWVYRKANGRREGYCASGGPPILLVVQGGRFERALDYARGVHSA